MKISSLLAGIVNRAGRNPGITLVVTIGIAAVVVRMLLDSRFGTSALLYMAVPFVITLCLLTLEPTRLGDGRERHWSIKYLRAFRAVFVVLFAVSILLYEGFLCVLMFLPIYVIGSLLAMAVEAIWRAARGKPGGTAQASALPLLVLAASLEGTHPGLSAERYSEVSATRVVNATPAALLANIAQPFGLERERGWFLGLFPMPDSIVARRLAPGEVHEVHFRYARWFVTNVHEGWMRLEISEVDADHVTTTILEDTSYISHYMTLHGTRIDFEPVDAASTRVTLTVRYDRKLDPAWYFSPLERYGVGRMAELLLQEVVVR